MSAVAGASGAEPTKRPDDRPVAWRLTLLFGAALPLGVLATQLLARFPDLVETGYSRSVFPIVRRVLGWITGMFPGHLAETLLIGAAVWIVVAALRGLSAGLRRRRSFANLALRGLAAWLRIGAVLYIAFLLSWGFNHARQPYAQHAQLVVAPVEASELEELLGWLVGEANGLRAVLDEGDWALRVDDAGYDPRLAGAYATLAKRVPALDAQPTPLRRAFLSPLLSRFGISGIYSPFTAEAHLNGELVDWLQPFVAAHEAAHGMGFAREDEANFIAWQVCRRAHDLALRYSGTLVALQFTAGALDGVDSALTGEFLQGLDPQVLDDLRRNREFWDAKRSFVTDLGRASNDAYLKLQGQAEGARSYGRMVDLLVAERRALAPSRAAGE